MLSSPHRAHKKGMSACLAEERGANACLLTRIIYPNIIETRFIPHHDEPTRGGVRAAKPPAACFSGTT